MIQNELTEQKQIKPSVPWASAETITGQDPLSFLDLCLRELPRHTFNFFKDRCAAYLEITKIISLNVSFN